jgi:hypothetical protein
MDSKSIFARTSKGEDEIRSKTAHLSGDIKRSLLMVDGIATFGEISKRAAPSLRSSLEEMFKALIQDGFIQEKAGTGRIFKKGAPSGMVPKMVVPSSKASAPKIQEDDEGDNDLDFASEYRAHSEEAMPNEADNGETEADTDAEAEARAHALAQAKAKQKAEEHSRAEAEAQARAKTEARARREAEAKTRNDIEGESTDSIEVQARALQQARELAEAKARQKSGTHTPSIEESANQEADEIARLEAEAKAKRDAEAKARAELIAQERALEAARARVEAEAKARREAEARARAEAEAKAKAKREAEARARAEAEAKAKREAEAKAKREAEARARADAEQKASREIDARELTEYEAESDIGEEMEVRLEPFDLTLPEAAKSPKPTEKHTGLGFQKDDFALMNDIGKFIQPVEEKRPPADKASVQSQEQEESPVSERTQNKTPPGGNDKSEMAKRKTSEYEVKILEETQSKVWAVAEQRAKEESKAKKESKSKALWDVDLPPEPQPAVKKVAPIVRAKRKPLPWFKLVSGLIALALIILFVAPFLIPTKQYIPGIVKLLSGKLKQPVYIEHLEGRLLPTPRLDLIDMAIGNDKQIKAKMARIDFSIPAFFTVVKSINSLELEGVEVDAAALQMASELLQQTAADSEFPIARILLKDGKLEAEGYALSGVGAEMNFNQAGKFILAKFNAEGNKYEWILESAPLYKTRVSISIHGSGLPLMPNWVFDELTAKGEMAGNELVITGLDGYIMGGTVHGNARLGWRSGWSAQGSLAAKTITMQNMLKVMSGNMDGTARFRMQAESLAKLADEATLEGSFVIKDGVINGIDIAETARLHRKENMPGGRTHFDELSGDLSYEKDAYAFRNLKLGAGVLEAKGTLDYSAQQVAGSIKAVLDFHQGVGPVSLELGGTSENPTLVAR